MWWLTWQNNAKQSWTKRNAEALELEFEDSDDDDETSVTMPVEKRELMKVQSLQQVTLFLGFGILNSISNNLEVSGEH